MDLLSNPQYVCLYETFKICAKLEMFSHAAQMEFYLPHNKFHNYMELYLSLEKKSIQRLRC